MPAAQNELTLTMIQIAPKALRKIGYLECIYGRNRAVGAKIFLVFQVSTATRNCRKSAKILDLIGTLQKYPPPCQISGEGQGGVFLHGIPLMELVESFCGNAVVVPFLIVFAS